MLGQQFVAVAKMPVGRRRADAGHARGIGEGEPGRALLRDQVERRLQQRLLQIAVVIAALGAALVLAPAHVKRLLHEPGAKVTSGRVDGPRFRV